ncbi:hypothetical protein L596_003867 [Steinernema carpocapsae]|uniref:Uncharacterized protein n=1 Tax=Steinernema carpocapsae TaxID=34508 RepID=A0A4U8UVJ2_STECR|nr:hypothetical protein L596_003867 [Steinernema carpocapsae]
MLIDVRGPKQIEVSCNPQHSTNGVLQNVTVSSVSVFCFERFVLITSTFFVCVLSLGNLERSTSTNILFIFSS